MMEIFLKEPGILASSILVSLASIPSLIFINYRYKDEDGGGAGLFGWLFFKLFRRVK